MARYIDADTVVELIDQRIRIVETLYGANRTASLAILRSYVKGLPTADVAPRAEVEKLQEVNADLNESLRLASEANKDLQAKVDRWRFGLEAVLEERAEDRAEVAREIFEELDKKIFNHIPDLHTFEIYTDLKKKYTQSEPPKGD